MLRTLEKAGEEQCRERRMGKEEPTLRIFENTIGTNYFIVT